MYFAQVIKLLYNQLRTGDLWDVDCDKVVALEMALPHRVSGTRQVLHLNFNSRIMSACKQSDQLLPCVVTVCVLDTSAAAAQPLNVSVKYQLQR